MSGYFFKFCSEQSKTRIICFHISNKEKHEQTWVYIELILNIYEEKKEKVSPFPTFGTFFFIPKHDNIL